MAPPHPEHPGATDLLSEFDPLQSAPPLRDPAQQAVFDRDSVRFAELTKLDTATAAVQIKAAKLKGMKFEEAVDRFYANNKAHVREGDQIDRMRVDATRARQATQESDAALARAIAEEDKEERGIEAAVDDMVAKLTEMGFDKPLALRAAQSAKTFREAAEFCVYNGKSANAAAAHPARPGSTSQSEEFAREGERRRAAMAVEKSGKLYKLARATSVLGARWQSRTFSLRHCALSYASGDSGKKRSVSLWECYVVRHREKVLGKDQVFVIYAGDRGPPANDAAPALLLASDDDEVARAWILAITLASGLPGHVLKMNDSEFRCSCVLPYTAEFEESLGLALSESRKVFIVKLEGSFKQLGLRINDEIVSINDQPAVDPKSVMLLLQRALRPFEIVVRRIPGRDMRIARSGSDTARINSGDMKAAVRTAPLSQPQGQVPTLDLLSLSADASPVKAGRPLSLASSRQFSSDTSTPDGRSADIDEDDSISGSIALVRSALDKLDQGINTTKTDPKDPHAARSQFHAAVQRLLSVQPAYAADQRVREAIAKAFPQHDLAIVYNTAVAHIQRMDQLIATQQQQEQQAQVLGKFAVEPPTQQPQRAPPQLGMPAMGAPHLQPQMSMSPPPMGATPLQPQMGMLPSQMGAPPLQPQMGMSPSPMGAPHLQPQLGTSPQMGAPPPRSTSPMQPPMGMSPQLGTSPMVAQPLQPPMGMSLQMGASPPMGAPPLQPPPPPPPPARESAPTMTHKAVYNFDAGESWQLAVTANEPLQVVETLNDGWSDCVNGKRQRGLVPSSYVERM